MQGCAFVRNRGGGNGGGARGISTSAVDRQIGNIFRNAPGGLSSFCGRTVVGEVAGYRDRVDHSACLYIFRSFGSGFGIAIGLNGRNINSFHIITIRIDLDNRLRNWNLVTGFCCCNREGHHATQGQNAQDER